ncbi:MAG: hypothetical protein JST89_14205 [Cyanobacteria bacterium SZAS-4]|nr:hypothetical protein [Cyanobacteria bacterium SZAS-4]
MPNPSQIETIACTVAAAEAVASKINFLHVMEGSAAQLAERAGRTDLFERLIVTSVCRRTDVPGKTVDLILSDNTCLTVDKSPFGRGFSYTKKFKTPAGTWADLSWWRASKLKVGDVVAEGYPVDGVGNWQKLGSTFPIRALRDGRDVVVEDLRCVGNDNFRLSLSSGLKLTREDFVGSNYARHNYADVTPWNRLNLIKAWTLKSGETVGREFPFQWVKNDRYLTNGELAFPRIRPEGTDWRHYPIQAVPERHWQGYLDGLHGKYLREMIPLRETLEQSLRTPRLQVVRELTPHQKELGKVLTERKIWDGMGSEQVSLSRDGSVIFEVKVPAKPSIFVVDKPGENAIYFFRDFEKATELASGQMARSAAMHEVPRLIHTGTIWKEKIVDVLKSIASAS